MARHDLTILKSTYSEMGPHKGYIDHRSESTFFFFSDDGGWFGTKKRFNLAVSQFLSDADYLIYANREPRPDMFGSLTFSDGAVSFRYAGAEAEGIALCVLDAAVKHKTPSRLYFPLRLPRVMAERVKATMFPEPGVVVEPFPHHALSDALAAELEARRCWPVMACREGRRLLLLALFTDETADIPLDKVVATVDDGNVQLHAKLLFGGTEIDGAEFCLGSPLLANAFLASLGLEPAAAPPADVDTAPSTSGLFSSAQVQGCVGGKETRSDMCDVELFEDALVVHWPDRKRAPVRFDFDTPGMTIDGTSDSFILADSDQTVLQIMPASEAFHSAVMANRVVRKIAARAANRGPFVGKVLGSHEFVYYDPARDGPVLIGAGRRAVAALTLSGPPTLEYEEDQYVLGIGSRRIQAQLPMLEGFAAAAAARWAAIDNQRGFHEDLTGILGLEGDYLSSAVLGDLVAAHLALADVLEIDCFAPLSQLEAENDRSTVLLFMIEAVPALARSIETAIHYLPAFCLEQDLECLRSLGLETALHPHHVEPAYQRALHGVAPLLSHLSKVDAQLSRLAALHRASASQAGLGKYLPLGVSAAASLVNPFYLIGVAQQGASLLASGSTRAAMEKEQRDDVFVACAQEWDYVMHTLLPALAYRLARDLYPIRLTVSSIFSAAYEQTTAPRQALLDAVRARHARLSVFREFPTTANPSVSREACVSFLLQVQKDAEEFPFRHF